MAADWSAQLNRVAGLQLAGKERRHLAVIHTVHCELQRGDFGRPRNRVTPFWTVAGFGRQPYGGVVARQVAGPVADRKLNSLHPTLLFTSGVDSCRLPGGWSRNFSLRRTAVPATG